jgi:hypothetical protein
LTREGLREAVLQTKQDVEIPLRDAARHGACAEPARRNAGA